MPSNCIWDHHSWYRCSAISTIFPQGICVQFFVCLFCSLSHHTTNMENDPSIICFLEPVWLFKIQTMGQFLVFDVVRTTFWRLLIWAHYGNIWHFGWSTIITLFWRQEYSIYEGSRPLVQGWLWNKWLGGVFWEEELFPLYLSNLLLEFLKPNSPS
jgi:hypothetical protein